MKLLRPYSNLCLYTSLILMCLYLYGCLAFESIDQPSSILPGEIFTVLIEVTVESDEGGTPYFGICLPDGWTIPGDAMLCTGVYNEPIVYDSNLALEQEDLSPSPDGYYWWVGDGNAVSVDIGSAYGEIQIQTDNRTGRFYLDYMLGTLPYDPVGGWPVGLNIYRSNNHLIEVVDEYTPRESTVTIERGLVLLSWVPPSIDEGLKGYNVYRDGQLINTNLLTDTECIDEIASEGIYFYKISSLYDNGNEHFTPYEIKAIVFLGFPGGTGEPSDPYHVATSVQLISISNDTNLLNKSYILVADIDLDPNLPGGRVFDKAVIAPDPDPYDPYRLFLQNSFEGVFDGNGHTISHLTIQGVRCLGLFGRSGPGARISNLGLKGVEVNGIGDYVGGLVGFNTCSITNSYSTGTVTGNGRVGGLVGSGGNINASYSTATVSGNENVGGLVGSGGSINTSYSTGSVNGDAHVGGLVGSGFDDMRALDGVVLQSVWDMETSGQTVSDGGVGLTTGEMMDPYMLGLNGFANDPNWVLDAGLDYPRLAWEGTAGQIIPEPIIDWLDGQGTEEEPYRIDTADQLILLRRASGLWDRHFILGADIDLNPNLQGRKVFSQAVIPVFLGVFDGNGHVISHLTIVGDSYLGLFGQTGSGAKISNLGLEAVDINGTGDYVGGLVGYNNEGSITSSYSTGTINGDDDVGGLVGWNNSSITSSYSTGAVSGEWRVGGFVGRNSEGSITSSYSTGTVNGGNAVGGLVGWNNGSITTSFWDMETSSLTNMCGSQHNDATGCDDSFGKTTVEMQTTSTFTDAGWDFVDETENGTEDIWWIDEGLDYPRLWWELIPEN